MNRAVLSIILIILILFSFGISCSNHPPDIIEVFAQKNLNKDPQTGVGDNTVSLFLHLQDEEGIDDIEAIYCIHDKAELFWELSADMWTFFEQDGETWIGSNGLTLPGYESLPGGSFRVVVIDAAGERNLSEIYLNDSAFDQNIEFPLLRISGETTIEIISPYPENTIWAFNSGNQPTGLFKTKEISVPVTSIVTKNNKAKTAAFYVYAYSNELASGLVSGPFFWEE